MLGELYTHKGGGVPVSGKDIGLRAVTRQTGLQGRRGANIRGSKDDVPNKSGRRSRMGDREMWPKAYSRASSPRAEWRLRLPLCGRGGKGPQNTASPNIRTGEAGTGASLAPFSVQHP